MALGLLLSASAAFAHSDAFKPEFVDTLVAPYLAIQKALASDDLDAAKTGANSFLDAMKHAPHEGEAHEQAADLSTPAKTIADTGDIKAARSSFLALSHEMISLVKHVGTSKDTDLFVAHCPMAFGGKGGDWMQSDKEVTNPYYGAMMLHCGSIQKQVSGEHHDAMEHHDGAMEHHEDGETDEDQEHQHMMMMQKQSSTMSQAKLDAIHAGVEGYKKTETASTSQSMGCCAQ